jgi:hypothetical protein
MCLCTFWDRVEKESVGGWGGGGGGGKLARLASVFF